MWIVRLGFIRPLRGKRVARESMQGALSRREEGGIAIAQTTPEPFISCSTSSSPADIAGRTASKSPRTGRIMGITAGGPRPRKKEKLSGARAKFPKSSKTSAARDRVRDNGKMHQRVRRDIFAYSFPNWVTEVTSAEGGPTEGPRALEESVSEPHVSKFSRRGWLREGRGNSGGQQNAAWPRIIPRVFGTIRMRRGRTARARGYLRGLRRRMRDPSRISGNFRIGRRSASSQQIRDTLVR